MSVLNQSGEEQVECPLCMEPLEVDDLNFFPCTCGYQICRFCWHRIRTDENGLCPACRKAYPENPADFKPLTQEEVAKLKAEKRQKDQQRKQKITENRKHLANVRVVQRNLVFVVGLPMRLADAEVLKKHEYFGKFGKIHKVVINQSTSYAGSQGPSASAYVTYHKSDDALRAIQAVNNISVDGRTVKTSLGTTKYCSHFMKNQSCPKSDCMYLHDFGDIEASFTKEEMQQGKHQEYEKKLQELLLNSYNQANKESVVQAGQLCNKEAWPSLQPGVSSAGTNSTGSNSVTSSANGSNNNGGGNNIGTGSSHHGNTKGERRHKADHVSSKGSGQNHKKRHAVDDHRGKQKEKLHNPGVEDHSSKTLHNKSNHSNSRVNSKSSKEVNHDIQRVTAVAQCQNQVPAETIPSDSSAQSVDSRVDSDVRAGDEAKVTSSTVLNEQTSSRGGASGPRALAASQRAATLFEPDNNSFFSSNSFTKVSASAAGSAGPEWPLSSLTLTHMPDVLPPVHSSEDWQAAFGFSNSAPGAPSRQKENSSQQRAASDAMAGANDEPPSSEQSGSKDGETCDPVKFESRNDQQSSVQGFNCHSSHSSSSENIETNILQNSSEEYGLSDVDHLNQKLKAFTLEGGNGTILDDAGKDGSGSESGGVEATSPNTSNCEKSSDEPCSLNNTYPNVSSTYAHDQIFMINRHALLPSVSHIVPNGLQPAQAAKFFSQFNLRQQNQPQNSHGLPVQVHNHPALDGTNFSRYVVDGGVNSKMGLMNLNSFGGSGDCSSVVALSRAGRETARLPNGRNSECESPRVTDDEKYEQFEGVERQRNCENSPDEYADCGSESENCVLENNEDITPKDGQRTTDDDLGFDPFHETQKALAEMMEKENMMLMLQAQQSHVPHPSQHMNHINHLHQQYQHMNHINHHPANFGPAAVFGGNKVLPGYNTSLQNHLLSQNSHRLQANASGVSGYSKLVDGLTLGPGSVPPPRTRLPPPGFSTAPNHMNAFGLGIPRAPANTGSKILPFMGLSSSSSSPSNGSSSPIPPPLNTLTNNISLSSLNSQPNVNPPPVMFPHSSSNHNSVTNHLNSSFVAQNGNVTHSAVPKGSSESFNVKEWSENMRSVLPNVNSGSGVSQSPVPVAFSGSNTPTPPPPPPPTSSSQNSSFVAPNRAASSSLKTWRGAGPCSDWTALDPAIVSSRPHSYLGSTNASLSPHPIILCNANSVLNQQNPNTQYLHLPNTTHWLRSLASDGCLLYGANISQNSNSDWTLHNHSSSSIAPPPPGFNLRMTTNQQTSVQNKLAVSSPQEITKIENI